MDLTNWYGWVEVIATARYIVNNTAPGDCCYMNEDSIEAMKLLASITPLQSAHMARALREAIQEEKELEEILQRRAEANL